MSLGNSNLNFQLRCDQVMHLETAANLCARCFQGNNFFTVCSILGLEGITKHFMIGSMGNREFYLPLTLSVDSLGETKLTISLGASHQVIIRIV